MMVALVFRVLLLCSGITTAQTAPPPANENFADSQAINSAAAIPTYTIKDLGTLPEYPNSFGTDVDDKGRVAGYAHNFTTGNTQAFLYEGGQMQGLGTLPGGTRSLAYGIADSGPVVGWSNTSSGAEHAFGRVPIGQMHDLGTLDGGTNSHAYAISETGWVAGWSNTSTGAHNAVLYGGATGQKQDIGTLGGGFSEATDINDTNQAVGWSDTSDGRHAFLYEGGQMKDLGTLPGGSLSDAEDINDSGQVVGWSTDSTGNTKAFLYSGGQMHNLNTLIPASSGWQLHGAMAINSSGQIGGRGSLPGASGQRAFIATPDTPTQEDTIDPEIAITTPPQGATYTVGQAVAAGYSCTDSGSGVASCEGPVADGANIDTSSAGTKTFTVRATDNVGNTNSVSHTYTVNAKTTETTAPKVISTVPQANATGVAPQSTSGLPSRRLWMRARLTGIRARSTARPSSSSRRVQAPG